LTACAFYQFAAFAIFILLQKEYSPARVALPEANYLVTSSYCFERFFSSPFPAVSSLLWRDFIARKNTYQAFFLHEKELGWQFRKEFCTGSGPRILIYERIKKPA
jgi:hypothetical protein